MGIPAEERAGIPCVKFQVRSLGLGEFLYEFMLESTLARISVANKCPFVWSQKLYQCRYLIIITEIYFYTPID